MADKEIENVILFQVDQTSKASKIYSQRELDKLGIDITIEQWVLLKIIEEKAPLSQKELAEKSLRDPASITRTLHLLEKKQLITREAIPNNRRQHNLFLTQQGVNFVNENMTLVRQLRKKSIEGFTQNELKTLSKLLLRIQQNMQ